jgi:hypothetical protein
MRNNLSVIETWLQDTILNRHITVANEGRIQAFRHILEMPNPTRTRLGAASREAHREADQRFFRADLLNHEVWRGVGDAFADAADLLPWPP